MTELALCLQRLPQKEKPLVTSQSPAVSYNHACIVGDFQDCERRKKTVYLW